MAKLNKQYYYNARNEKKINCYKVNISKDVVNKTDLKDKKIKVYAKNNKIIIERED